MNMKLGWWRDASKRVVKIVRHDSDRMFPWRSITDDGYTDDGGYSLSLGDPRDLIEFLRPLEELPPSLNSAVKAAEDMVRRLERHHAALRNQANEAWEILTQAKRELERLEKECEVKP